MLPEKKLVFKMAFSQMICSLDRKQHLDKRSTMHSFRQGYIDAKIHILQQHTRVVSLNITKILTIVTWDFLML